MKHTKTQSYDPKLDSYSYKSPLPEGANNKLYNNDELFKHDVIVNYTNEHNIIEHNIDENNNIFPSTCPASKPSRTYRTNTDIRYDKYIPTNDTSIRNYNSVRVHKKNDVGLVDDFIYYDPLDLRQNNIDSLYYTENNGTKKRITYNESFENVFGDTFIIIYREYSNDYNINDFRIHYMFQNGKIPNTTDLSFLHNDITEPILNNVENMFTTSFEITDNEHITRFNEIMNKYNKYLEINNKYLFKMFGSNKYSHMFKILKYLLLIVIIVFIVVIIVYAICKCNRNIDAINY